MTRTTMTSTPDHLRIAHQSSDPNAARRHFMPEDVFRGALGRERKRSDRSNQPIAVMTVTLHDADATAACPIWSGVLNALASIKRDTDIAGWFKPNRTIGVLMTDIPSYGQNFARELEARASRELGRRLAPEAMNRVSVRVHVHAHQPAAAGRGVDPLFDGFHTHARATMYDALKRALDIAGSAALLVALSPLLLVIGALVKLTSAGPMLFRQTRVGRNMKPFEMLKFRTMRVNIKHDIHQEFVTNFIKSGSKAQPAASGVFKITNDPRVTSIGRFLRKTSLDELPQLWNVCRGDMSLVGPRPPLPYEVAEYQAWHCRRVLEAKPGITGLWQVNGRSRTTFDEMVRLDLRYARTRSFWADVKILLATPAAVIAGKGAY